MKVTPEEARALQEIADAQGVTVPRLLFESAMAEPMSEERRRALDDLHTVVAIVRHLAEYTNGLARWANEQKVFPPEAERIPGMWAAVVAEVYRVLERIHRS